MPGLIVVMADVAAVVSVDIVYGLGVFRFESMLQTVELDQNNVFLLGNGTAYFSGGAEKNH